MLKRLLAALIGIGAGLALFGAYIAFLRMGGQLRPDIAIVGAAAVTFSSAVGVFALMALDRPAFRGARAALKLNEDPAVEFIFPFRGQNLAQITLKPETPLAMALARFGNTFARPASEMNKAIMVTLKASRRISFPTVTLQQLFLMLKEFNLQHVLLLDDRDHFVAYLPGKRALKEFTGNDGAEKITKYIVSVLDHPENSELVHEIGGAAQSDTIKSAQDIGDAQKELWKSEAIQGLVVMKGSRPMGYISRMDVLTLHAGLP